MPTGLVVPAKLSAHELGELLHARRRGLAPPADELALPSRVRELRVREDLLERCEGLSRLRRDWLRDVGRPYPAGSSPPGLGRARPRRSLPAAPSRVAS